MNRREANQQGIKEPRESGRPVDGAESVVSRTAGALKGNRRPLSAEEPRRAAEAAIAQDVIERVRS